MPAALVWVGEVRKRILNDLGHSLRLLWVAAVFVRVVVLHERLVGGAYHRIRRVLGDLEVVVVGAE